VAKCEALIEATLTHSLNGRETQIGPNTYTYEDMPTLECVLGTDQYDCMSKIFNNEADLIELGTGLSYTAGQYYNMIPLVAEKYMPGYCHFELYLICFSPLMASKDHWVSHKTPVELQKNFDIIR